MFSRHRISLRLGFRGIVCFAALLCSLLLLPRVALADDYSIDRVDIDATIQTDGTLSVVEYREFDFDGSFHGVYWKIPVGEYNGRTIDAVIDSVGELQDGVFVPFTEDYSGDDHTYQLSDYGSYMQVKLYSAHSDESATFAIAFDYTNLAARHEDVSELYWKFVSDGWDVESENVTCTVHLPVPDGKKVEPEENVRAWGHGPLDASVHFDGNDVVYWVPGVGTSEFAEARITFPTEWLSDATSQGDRVLQNILAEERQWADEANARRERARMLTYGGGVVGLIATLAAIVGSIFTWIRYRRTHKAMFDDKYFRDVPSDDHPAVLGALYRGGEASDEDFTATLMRLTDLGAIGLELVTIEGKGILGKVKSRQDYRLTMLDQEGDYRLTDIDRSALHTLFDRIGRRAPKHEGDGSGRNQICFSDIERVAKKHPESFHDAYENWLGKVRTEVARRGFFAVGSANMKTGRGVCVGCAVLSGLLFGATIFYMVLTEAWLISLGLLLLQVVGLLVGIFTAIKCKPISAEAIELKAQLEALRRWLKDFTRLEEAVPRDVMLWDRLLVMAVVLGVADEVIKQLKMSVPELLDDPRLANTYGWYYAGPSGRPYSSFNSSYSTAHSVSSAKLAASESSSGGGGGGGFSGGGGGGFGGGGGGGAF